MEGLHIRKHPLKPVLAETAQEMKVTIWAWAFVWYEALKSAWDSVSRANTKLSP